MGSQKFRVGPCGVGAVRRKSTRFRMLSPANFRNFITFRDDRVFALMAARAA